MRMVLGSHRGRLQPHRDTFPPENLLSRGQEMAGGVDEADTVDIELRPGQFSMHHGRVFHGSHPNRSDERRLGFAIIRVSPAMRNRDGIKPMVRIVRGSDRYCHFEPTLPPREVMGREGVERLRRAKARAEAIYYRGTERRLESDAIGCAAGG